jgi:hypothetical protein
MKVGFVVWVLFGIAAAVVAAIRKGSVRLWFGVGMLLGPIGLGLAFMGGYRCTWCKERVSFKAIACPYCFRDISGWEIEIEDRQVNGLGERRRAPVRSTAVRRRLVAKHSEPVDCVLALKRPRIDD